MPLRLVELSQLFYRRNHAFLKLIRLNDRINSTKNLGTIIISSHCVPKMVAAPEFTDRRGWKEAWRAGK